MGETGPKPTSSFFSTPRLFTSFTSKPFSESEAVMSPTSILETKPFFGLRNPFCSKSSTKRHWDYSDSSKGIGLVIVDASHHPKSPKPQTRMVTFGSQLKIQIPPLHSPKLEEAVVFEIEKTNESLVSKGCLSVSEMELSEDYTCVISHGPNPRTTHIFDNCVVESCDGVPQLSPTRKENKPSYPSQSFLSFCCHCKINIEQGKDIYMYRGEKAFCSSECRYQEMMLEEEEGS